MTAFLLKKSLKCYIIIVLDSFSLPILDFLQRNERTTMSNFRKFTEFCAGISVFAAIMYVLRQYLEYNFKDVESTKEKLKIFFDPSSSRDYRGYILLAALLLLAIAVSLVFKRVPELSFFLSALPLLYVIYLYDAGRLYERPMLFFCLSIVQITGNLFDSLKLSEKGRKYSPVITSFFASLIPLLCCLLTLWRKGEVTNIPLDKLYPFDLEIMRNIDDIDVSLFKTIAVMYGVILLISIILRGVHFIDFFLSLVPLVFVIYKQSTEALGPHHEIIMAAAILCSITHLCLTVGARSKAFLKEGSQDL